MVASAGDRWPVVKFRRHVTRSEESNVVLPKPLVMFLAFCGGAALFAAPLLLGAIVLGGNDRGGTGGAPNPIESGTPGAAASTAPSTHPASDELLGDLAFHAFDLGFEPTGVEVDAPGRYAVTFTNDGAVFHDITFADGTVVEANPGESGTAEIVVPEEGLGFICSVPGHADAGM